MPGTPPIQVVVYYSATQEALDVIYNLNGDLSPISPVAVACSSSKRTKSKKSSKSSTDIAEGDGWKMALRRFWECNQSYCDERFKLIPNVVCCILDFNIVLFIIYLHFLDR